MKKKMIQKLLTLTLSAAMVLGALTGCGGDADSQSGQPEESTKESSEESKSSEASRESQGSEDDASQSEESESSSGTAEGAGMEGWRAFAENVTLKIPVYDRGAEGVPDVKDNYWTKWVQENFGDQYNITVQYIPITRTQVMQDYALLSSSQNLPTILMEYDYDKLATWAEEGYLQTIDLDAFQEVAPTYYGKMVENNQLVYTELNDEKYFVLAERPYYNTTPNFITFYRLDWLEQVGYDHIPLDRGEYLDAMQKIMDAGIAEHPGGGAMFASQGGEQVYSTREFPLNEEEWAMYGDFNIPSMSWPAHKEVLRRANEDYNLGITNPEYYTIDATTAEANFTTGKTYAYGAYMAPSMPILDTFYANNPDAKLAVYTFVGEDRKTQPDPVVGDYPLYRADNAFGMTIGFSNFASEDEVKAAWMYLEWMIQPENLHTIQWGVEGETYNLDENGFEVAVSDYEGEYKLGYNGNKDYWCAVIEARNVGDMYDNIKLNSPKGYPQDFTEEITAIYDLNVKKAELGYPISDALFAVTINSVDEYRGDLQMKYAEFKDQLVMCAPEEFDALYDQLAQEYLDMGYQEILDERKAAYEAGKTTKLPDNQKAK
ncbi:MAG: extracellular solute-binding protein [Lachnospiraceae bacterium]|jgi:putative aldouronate transport system substrate-binding protein|nr:extracellular solute-binding protein [uncultured Acetatifactor sp.]MCI9218285.1 extracellular solute-binding protein [Lachnospiraceae bacterium]